MTGPDRSRQVRAAGGLTGRQLEAEVSREVARIQSEHQAVLPTGKCRVCQHPDSRQRINTLLSYGMGASEILNFVDDINEKRTKNNRITLDSIRNHKQRHFNIQAPTQAGFRRIMERRKAQLSDEYGDAVGNLLTGMAYLDVVAQKGWQHLINEETVVDYEIGLKAMLQLEHMQREGAVEEQIAQMRRDVGLLQQAVKDVAAEKYPDLQKEILERIDELTGQSATHNEAAEVIDAEVVDDYFDQEDNSEGVSPKMESDEGDSIEE